MTDHRPLPETERIAAEVRRRVLLSVVVCGCAFWTESASAGLILSASDFESSAGVGPSNQQTPVGRQPSSELRLLDDSAIPVPSGGMGNPGTVPGASSSPAIVATISQPPKATLVARLANHWQLVLPPPLPTDLLRPPRS